MSKGKHDAGPDPILRGVLVPILAGPAWPVGVRVRRHDVDVEALERLDVVLAPVPLAPVDPETLVIPGSELKPGGEVSPHATRTTAARG